MKGQGTRGEAWAVPSGPWEPKLEFPAELFSGVAALMVLDFGTSRGDCRVGLSANRVDAIFEVPATVSVTFPRC